MSHVDAFMDAVLRIGAEMSEDSRTYEPVRTEAVVAPGLEDGGFGDTDVKGA